MNARKDARARARLDTLLTAAEAAHELAVCARTLRNFVYRGELTPIRVGSRAIRFRSSDIARIQVEGIRQ